MSEIIKDNSNKKKTLGRGLGSLLGAAQEATSANAPGTPGPNLATQKAALANQTPSNVTVAQPPPQPQVPAEARVWQVGIDKMIPSQYQPRTHFEKEKLEELASSIKQNGILQPIVARKLQNGAFEIIAGERRWRAAQLAGLHEVPVILKKLENQAALELAIIENIQREDLNAIEEAEAYERLAKEFNLTQQQVADKVGKDRATVANMMRLLALPFQIKDMVTRAEISAGHAKVLLSLQDSKLQMDWAKKVAEQKMSVRQLEKTIAAELEKAKSLKAPESAKDLQSQNMTQRLISGMAEELQKILGTKVSIDYANSKGKISVHFYSDEELTQLVDHLKEANG